MSFDPDQLGKAADGVARSPFAAGLFGALVTALRGMPGSTWKERSAHSFSGALMASYLGPGTAEFFMLNKTQGLVAAVAFLIGMFGLNISAAIWAYLKTVKVSDWLPWITKRGSD